MNGAPQPHAHSTPLFRQVLTTQPALMAKTLALILFLSLKNCIEIISAEQKVQLCGEHFTQ